MEKQLLKWLERESTGNIFSSLHVGVLLISIFVFFAILSIWFWSKQIESQRKSIAEGKILSCFCTKCGYVIKDNFCINCGVLEENQE